MYGKAGGAGVMGNCKDCRHWGGVIEDDPGNPDLHIVDGRRRECRLIPLTKEPYSRRKRNKLVVAWDCSGRPQRAREAVALLTAPTFGCLLFEAKEPL